MANRKQKRIEIDGVTHWVSGQTEKEIIASIIRLARETNNTVVKKSTKPKVRFRDYADSWFLLYKQRKVKFREAQNHQIILKKHLYPFFGKMDLAKVGTEDIQLFYNQKVDKGYAGSTIHKMETILKQIFRSAIEDNLIEKNPAISTRLSYSKREERREPLSMEKAIALFNALGNIPRVQDRLLIAFPIFAGTRRGETLGLRWEHIDWINRFLCIRQSIYYENGKPNVGRPKTKAGIRDIPLDNLLASILIPIKKDMGYIIGDGVNPMTECAYRRSWERIKSHINLNGKTAHHLRHTYITFAESSGIDLKTLQAIAGHADASTTLNRYAHQRKDILKGAGETLNKVFSQIGESVAENVANAK